MKKKILFFLYISAILNLFSFELPEIEPIVLKPFSTFSDSMINESSALVKSKNFENVFWTLNDSGDDARIFPVNRNGELLIPEWVDNYKGVYIMDAVNIDWEEMAISDNGNLIIGACGNNGNVRKDLAIYIVEEPHPLGTHQTRYLKKIPFYYPEQKSFPPTKANFDCEAIFTVDNDIYLLTKHRSDTNTCLYKVGEREPFVDNPLIKLDEFEIGGMVTAADCSNDGKNLAVLTYNNIWIFEKDNNEKWFDGKKLWMPISAKQCEAICFDGNDLLITNEQMQIFEVPMNKFIEIND